VYEASTVSLFGETQLSAVSHQLSAKTLRFMTLGELLCAPLAIAVMARPLWIRLIRELSMRFTSMAFAQAL
jgi:hypothetical protein